MTLDEPYLFALEAQEIEITPAVEGLDLLSVDCPLRRLRRHKLIYFSLKEAQSSFRLDDTLLSSDELAILSQMRIFLSQLLILSGGSHVDSADHSESLVGIFESQELFNLVRRDLERKKLFAEKGIQFRWSSPLTKFLKSFIEVERFPPSDEVPSGDFDDVDFREGLEKAAGGILSFFHFVPMNKRKFFLKVFLKRGRKFFSRNFTKAILK